MSYTEIKLKQVDPNYVTPVSNHRLGWLAFADGYPIDAVVSNDDMRRGWLQALRDYANSEAVTAFA